MGKAALGVYSKDVEPVFTPGNRTWSLVEASNTEVFPLRPFRPIPIDVDETSRSIDSKDLTEHQVSIIPFWVFKSLTPYDNGV